MRVNMSSIPSSDYQFSGKKLLYVLSYLCHYHYLPFIIITSFVSDFLLFLYSLSLFIIFWYCCFFFIASCEGVQPVTQRQRRLTGWLALHELSSYVWGSDLETRRNPIFIWTASYHWPTGGVARREEEERVEGQGRGGLSGYACVLVKCEGEGG